MTVGTGCIFCGSIFPLAQFRIFLCFSYIRYHNNNNNNNEFLNRMALQYMRTVIKGVL